MKYYLDTEFIEDGNTIDLISIGLASEDDRTLYLQNSECRFARASDWVWRNVYPHLRHFEIRGPKLPREKAFRVLHSDRLYDELLGQDR